MTVSWILTARFAVWNSNSRRQWSDSFWNVPLVESSQLKTAEGWRGQWSFQKVAQMMHYRWKMTFILKNRILTLKVQRLWNNSNAKIELRKSDSGLAWDQAPKCRCICFQEREAWLAFPLIPFSFIFPFKNSIYKNEKKNRKKIIVKIPFLPNFL